MRTRTRSHGEANAYAFTRGCEHDRTQTQTLVRYTLHLSGTVYIFMHLTDQIRLWAVKMSERWLVGDIGG